MFYKRVEILCSGDSCILFGNKEGTHLSPPEGEATCFLVMWRVRGSQNISGYTTYMTTGTSSDALSGAVP